MTDERMGEINQHLKSILRAMEATYADFFDKDDTEEDLKSNMKMDIYFVEAASRKIMEILKEESND